MSKQKELEKLFAKWKSEKDFYETDFYADGIINEVLYNQVSPGKRLLFIAKEPNASNHEKNIDRSFITEWNTTKPTYNFAKRISEWARGIIEDFPVFDEICDKDETLFFLKRISFMNVKKSGGKGIIDNAETFKNWIKNHEAFIRKEIEIIEPDIIILSLSQEEKIREILFPRTEWISSGYTCKIAKWKNARVIDFYHPSARNVAAASYSLLQNIIQSIAFKEL